ncbi:ATP-dependent helicase [Candidatus Gottesmanbacteria bacterium]|nr:ATP-dependent helicase [Candidatus Gottesmanbacteria bacterium]
MSDADKRILNDEQKDAVEHGEGPLLIIAGAGTGKTTVITERIVHLITSGRAKPQEILALTFTEKASQEMEERVDKALPYGVTQMWISTFHAFCDRVIRAHGIHIGIDPGFRVMTEAETIQFFKRHLFSFGLSYFRPLGNPQKFIQGMITHFSRLKDEDVTPNAYLDWVKSNFKNQKSKMQTEEKEEREKYRELAEAYGLYEKLKLKESVFDFSDLISYCLKLFRERSSVLKEYQDQFSYVLIDEFQDTNFAQNELAMLLAAPKNNLTVVGDDDQAIYRWRGAAVSNIVQFRSTYKEAKVIVLTKNYRSTQEILDRSHDAVEHNNPDRLEVVEKIDKKLESMRRIKGEQVQLILTNRGEDEADEVVKLILKIKNQISNKYEWRDFAILVRANAHAEPFVRSLSRAGIPYQFLGPGQLLRQAEIKDLIAYLTLLTNFYDNVAFYRVLSMDWMHIDGRDIVAIAASARKQGISLFEVCEKVESLSISEASKSAVASFVSMVHRHMERMKKESAGQILYYFLEDSGLLVNLAAYKTEADERRAMNVAKFFNKLKSYETTHGDASVFAVLDWISLSLDLGESPASSDTDWAEENAVNILTIHGSKGLEFPVVFVVNLVSGRFPTIERKEQIPLPDVFIHEILPSGEYHEQEERRIFYVAMTRARDHLIVSGSKFYNEGKRERKLSPFIGEALGERISNIQYPISNEEKQLSFLDWGKKEEAKPSPKNASPVSFLSYSQLNSFETCPLQYKYRYIVKLPVPPSAALSFGDTIHKTVYAFYDLVRKGERPTSKTLLSLYTGFWSRIGYGNASYEEKMKAHGVELLEGFYKKGYIKGHVPIALEEPFKIKITPHLTLGGKVDRIDAREDGKVEIIDYKTGKTPKNRDVTKDFQLSVYALAATAPTLYTRKPEDVIVSFYFFEDQMKVSGTRTQEQLDEARETVKKRAEEIQTSTFSPTSGKHCDFCEFKLICEAWQ